MESTCDAQRDTDKSRAKSQSRFVSERSPAAGHVTGRSAGGGDIALQGVVHDHAVGVEAPAQSTDRALHALDPAVGEAVGVALVVERDYFVAEHSIQIVAVAAVVDVHV